MKTPTLLATLLLIASFTACAPRGVPPEPQDPGTEQTPPETTPPEPEPPPAEETEEPAAEPTEQEPPAEPEPPATPEPRPDLLYERTEEELRLEFSEALYSRYGMDVAPYTPDRLDAAELRAWLADLDGIAPEVAARSREALGGILDQRYAVGFILPGVVEDRCARFDDILYVAVPERFRRAGGLAAHGLLIRDACVPPADALCLVCSSTRSAAGESTGGQDAAACTCVCTLDTCPAVECDGC